MKLKLILFMMLAPIWLLAQENKGSEVHQKLESKTFVFEANQAFGARGRVIFLDPGYTLTVEENRVVGNLPFFGRAYTASYGTTDVGLKFEFAEYEYQLKDRKKKGWDITIKPTTAGSDVRSIYLTIQETGNATLRIISNGKDTMSYSGMLK